MVYESLSGNGKGNALKKGKSDDQRNVFGKTEKKLLVVLKLKLLKGVKKSCPEAFHLQKKINYPNRKEKKKI